MLLSALQHIFAGLKRTRDQNLSSGLSFAPSPDISLSMICEHVVGVSVPPVVEQLFVVPKILSQTESCSVPWNRFLAVPLTLFVEQLVKC